MTFKDSMIKAMIIRGMFSSQAEKVIESYIVSNQANSMMDRWDEDVSGYPETLQNALWMSVKDHAAEWIKINIPQAWFRPMFEHTKTALALMMNDKKEGVTKQADEATLPEKTILNNYLVIFYNRFACQTQTHKVQAENVFRAGRLFYQNHNRKQYHSCIESIVNTNN